MWLFIGLLVTFCTGYTISLNETMITNIASSGVMWMAIIVELGIAIFFGVRITKMSKTTAIICYILYSFTTGLTFAFIFLAYKMASIMMIFGITALLFAIFGLYGYYTKRDLSKIGSFLFMGLIAIILTSIVNIFLHSSGLTFMISIVALIIFLGYIAYDIKNIDYLAYNIGEDKAAIYGAFQLYLDFINLFIHLLQLFGNSNDN